MGFSRFVKFFRPVILAFAATVVLSAVQSCEAVNGVAPEFPVKDKTVLIYMIANNDLSGNAVSNLSDIKRGYIPQMDEGNIILYYHIPNQNPLLLNVFKDETGNVAVDTAYKFPARNSATKASLQSAMKVTATMFPADEYGLILWSHGTGWLPAGFYADPKEDIHPIDAAELSGSDNAYMVDPYSDLVKMVKGADVRSFGSDSGKEMEIADVVAALPYKLSFVIFDACLMGGIEVMYEMKDSTDYIISSPTEILSAGFPYSQIMQHIFAEPADLEAVAREYYNLYNGQQHTMQSATVSLVKTSELENVAQISKEIFAANRTKISSVNVSSVQRYYRMNKHWFYDFGHFMEKIATPEQYEQFVEALNKAVIYKAATPKFFDITINEFSGVSTYIPVPYNTVLGDSYKALKWNDATGFIE